MSGNYSPSTQQKLAAYEAFTNDIGRINSLVEQFAVARSGQDTIKASLRRAASHAKLKFMTSGMAQLSQLAGSIELITARSGPPAAAARALREAVGQLKFQLELEMRIIIKEDEAESLAKKRAKEAAKEEAAKSE